MLDFWMRVAVALGVSMEYLVTGEEPDNHSRIAAIREQLKAIDDELQKMQAYTIFTISIC